MKKLILSLFVVLLGATSAMGQGYTADWVVKSSNELLYLQAGFRDRVCDLYESLRHKGA